MSDTRAWFEEGFRAGFCSDIACATHDSYPLYTQDELNAADEDFDDTCLPVVRLLHPDEQAVCHMSRLDEAIDLMRLFVDPEPCSRDHHGFCQAHNWTSLDCPQARLKRFLGLA